MDHALRRYRKASGVTLQQLADEVGVSKGFLSKIENRVQLPSLDLATKLARATNGAVSVEDFSPAPAQGEPQIEAAQ